MSQSRVLRHRILNRPRRSGLVPSLYDWGVATYRQHVRQLLAKHGRDEAFHLAVGGGWDVMGPRLVGSLVLAGLGEDHDVVDVGCGSGRLAVRLEPLLRGRYLGIDVVPELVDYARACSMRPDWRFECVTSLSIPAPDNSADFICFFSVLTHLPHEQSFMYLQEARRVVRPGGRVIASFLEFAEPAHWTVFESTKQSVYDNRHHNQFIHRDDLRIWCEHLGLSIDRFVGGAESSIPLLDGLRPTGTTMTLGQSLAILVKDGVNSK